MSSVYIVLLNWHGWQDTINCLDSLTTLSYPNYRVLVVDNGSTDDSAVRIRAAHPEVPIIETGRNLGFSGGCNVGIRRALEDGADYVWLLNNDTTVDPQALSAMVAVAEADPRVGAVGSVLYYLDSPQDIQAWGGGRVSFWSGRAHQYLAAASNAKLDYLTAASMLIRRSALEKVGLLDEKFFFMYWEDTDYSFRLRRAGWRIVVAEESTVFHKEHASTGKGSALLDQYFNESAVCFFRRHATYPIWPIFVSSLGRLTKRILLGNRHRFVATLRGIYIGLRKTSV
ncbi:glycosyltransferase family 2 protein [Acidithiobacillus ferridurans]|jgi:GT2 family glycosyltransferase|uniref:Glycosyltransferase family 2 protein n=2 Tax=Acidithiobacillus ferridurans TaxID=1232575 RepID=A0A8X8GC38_ACIFI|nr:glycosyltransferase family 2 protein [Acidithiobacillus ferridurans]MBU2716269.1 glycosyltransferase family 2 protein [Acidithiobacillus ferridurans]MBU2723559.1 glycosyltransferase family 2 protein [Acidithiobacillus ferridurans]MBU2726472.1 glycosyltransferase family 2 protein [Acidithiobacillus ferridurans]BBF65118.1 N-acetylglucosaminyl-diphospho-decaprenol L-rhamnosyltransferase [Acidithiobacillus ferridurans]